MENQKFTDTNERERIEELKSYNILDTAPERYLDELVEIASAICNTPVSLLSLVDKDRQWFKAATNFDQKQTPRRVAFCQHALHTRDEVLVVEDALKDDRFRDNPLVLEDPNIRFYAGAPLVTPRGNVLGTLCVIDKKQRSFSKNQKKMLQLLSCKAMDYLETRKTLLSQDATIEKSASRIKKLTDLAPLVIYQLELTPEGKLFFSFISDGIRLVHPNLDPEELKKNAELCYEVVLPEDLEMVQQSLMKSYQDLTVWDIEYRVVHGKGPVSWHRALATPERKEDGTVVWYGIFQDVTHQKKYIQTLEKILFDISHVMRRPVADMLSLTAAMESDELNEENLRTYSEHIKSVSRELDNFIHKLNSDYSDMKKEFLQKGTSGLRDLL